MPKNFVGIILKAFFLLTASMTELKMLFSPHAYYKKFVDLFVLLLYNRYFDYCYKNDFFRSQGKCHSGFVL